MKTKIHQIFYHESQKDSLDPAFIPYNNEGRNYPYNFEYAVFFDLYKNVDWNETDLLGTVSWKFHQKTGLSGQQVLEHIKANPGYDVYFVNPFPELCIYRSVWDHGEEFHPRLKVITRQLFEACGYDTSLLEQETPPNLTAYCNYWVGNRTFWDEYITYLKPIWERAHMDNGALGLELRKIADPFIKAPYMPFVFERLFSTFLSQKRAHLKSSPLSINSDKLKKNPYLSLIHRKIVKISNLESRSSISLSDKLAVCSMSKLRKLRHYQAPLLLKKIKYVLHGNAE